jgi:HlyD family secretion protein
MMSRFRSPARPRTTLLAVSAVAIVGLAVLSGGFGGGGPGPIAAGPGPRMAALVAPGLVEPISEELQIAADVPGILASVPVDEGDPIVKGQLLAEIENADLKAALAQAEAGVLRRQAELDKLENGSRQEERQQAAAAEAEALASEDQARRDLARKAPLAADGVESQSVLDQATAAAARAQARRRALNAERALVESAPRPEDVRIAQAALAEARASVVQIQAQIDKTIFRSPIDGVVLSRRKRAGEAVTNVPPTLILQIGDISRLRVRADVDETDVARVAVGQRVQVTADAYPGRRFGGRIVRVGSSLGRKNFRTERATEKIDTKILETMIELDPDVRLPVGLRVDVWDGDAVTPTDGDQPPPAAPIPAISAVFTPAEAPPAAGIAENTGKIATDSPPPPGSDPAKIRVSSNTTDAVVQQILPDPGVQPADATGSPPSGTGRDPVFSPATAALVTPTASAKPPPAPAGRGEEPGPAKPRVTLRAADDSWIQVRDGHGKSLVNRLLRAGEVYEVPDQPGLTLMAGNAGGLEVQVDGATIPRLGKPNRVVRDVALDPDRLAGRPAGTD